MEEQNQSNMEQVPKATGKPQLISLPVSILAAAILISGSIIYSAHKQSAAPSAGNTGNAPIAQEGTDAEVPAITDTDAPMGNASAPVSIILYADYQCPFCGRFFSSVEPSLIQDYVQTGKARFVHRDFAFLGPESFSAAEAAECSKDQGKFWQFHDALYAAEIKDGQENNGNLNRTLFVKLAKQVGMNSDTFGKCLDDKKYTQRVLDISSAAKASGVDSTPTTFINGKKIQGAQNYSVFSGAIDAILKK